MNIILKMSKKIFYSALLLIILLLIFNIKLMSLDYKFKDACIEDYSSFIESQTCPCTAQWHISDWDLIKLNSSDIINISMDKK